MFDLIQNDLKASPPNNGISEKPTALIQQYDRARNKRLSGRWVDKYGLKVVVNLTTVIVTSKLIDVSEDTTVKTPKILQSEPDRHCIS